MSSYRFIGLVVAAGLVGGVFNALVTAGGFELPRIEKLPGHKTFVPGFIGNILMGAFVAIVLAVLYGPLGDVLVSNSGAASAIPLTLRSFGGAALSGFGGARLLSQEVDRRFSQGAASNVGIVSGSTIDFLRELEGLASSR
jgi:hypothetical protein